MRIFGIDPGSRRTGYGCVERDRQPPRLVICGSLSGPPRATFPDRLNAIHDGLTALLVQPSARLRRDRKHLSRAQRAQRAEARPRARRRAARRVGSRRAGRRRTRPRRSSARSSATAAPRSTRCSRWSSCCSASTQPPSPHDVADALAVAICHLQSSIGAIRRRDASARSASAHGRRQAAIVAAVVARLSTVIALLRGTLVEKHPSRVIVDVAGVGYDVQVPLSTFYGLGEPGATVIAAHSHARARGRDRALRLRTPLEQDLFERLISISGIGPKLALAVLSGIEPADLMRAIRSQDVARLTRIPASARRPPSGSAWS